MPSERDFFYRARERAPYHNSDSNSDDSEKGFKSVNRALHHKNKNKDINLDNNEYMDLDEFVQQTPVPNKREVNKLSVNLLASLLALGKIVAERQLKTSPTISGTQTLHTSSTFSLSNSLPQGFHCIPSFSSAFAPTVPTSERSSTPDLNISIQSEESNSTASSSSSKPKKGKGYRYEPKELPKRTAQNASGDDKDPAYWDRRERNNLAARKSREERRRKELEVMNTLKSAENENAQLKARLNRLQDQNKLLEAEFNKVIGREHIVLGSGGSYSMNSRSGSSCNS